MKIYFISGLGADERVFKHIKLPSNCEPVHLSWIKPGKNESLHDYAMRMAERINPDEKFALIGLSFGGMIATEIAKKFKPEKVILISSIPSTEQLPIYYKLAGKIGLQKILPISFIKNAAFVKRLITNERSEDKKMLRAMIRECDDDFIRWAMTAILKWDNKDIPKNLVHLHGTNDGILPVHYTKPTHPIRNGSHLMVLTKAREINGILRSLFS
jgi:pimeloyl-ACP methyl ester carboxylesterase